MGTGVPKTTVLWGRGSPNLRDPQYFMTPGFSNNPLHNGIQLKGIPLCSEMTARGRRPLTLMFEQWRGRLPEVGNLAARALSH